MLTLLLMAACDAPPPLRDPVTFTPNTMDTMAPIIEEEEVEEAGNRRPRVLYLKVTPDKLHTDTPANVAFRAEDPEGANLSTSFQWFINSRKRIGQNARRLPASFFRRGDLIAVELTVNDGENEVVVMSDEMEVLNTPPTMQLPRGPIGSLDGYRVPASDPDGDTLTFSIENGPPGLSINSRGELRYSGSNSAEGGSFSMTITATDPDGESVSLPLSIQVTAGQEAGRTGPGGIAQ